MGAVDDISDQKSATSFNDTKSGRTLVTFYKKLLNVLRIICLRTQCLETWPLWRAVDLLLSSVSNLTFYVTSLATLLPCVINILLLPISIWRQLQC